MTSVCPSIFAAISRASSGDLHEMHAAFETIRERPLPAPAGVNLRLHHRSRSSPSSRAIFSASSGGATRLSRAWWRRRISPAIPSLDTRECSSRMRVPLSAPRPRRQSNFQNRILPPNKKRARPAEPERTRFRFCLTNYFLTISAFSNMVTPPLFAILPFNVTVLPAKAASSSFIGLCAPTTR